MLKQLLRTCTIQGNADGSTAVDYTVNCATGYPAVTGGATPGAPVNHVLPARDIACAYQAVFAVLAAFIRAEAAKYAKVVKDSGAKVD